MNIAKLSAIIIIGITVVFLAYAGFVVYSVWPITLGNLEKAGVFGDSFGVLTALFSGLAFAGIIVTILLQRDELALQREELRLTRGELTTQNATAKLQTFENTFFQMLRVHNDLLNSIDLSRNVKNNYVAITRGRDCFNIFYDHLQFWYKRVNEGSPDKPEAEKINEMYLDFWREDGHELAHYFRSLYTMFRFVEARAPDKRFYSRIVRAQLSDQELLVLFYNCQSELGCERFRPLTEKFAVFNNLPESRLIDVKHKDLYGLGAFDWVGGSDS